jgi:hypothetical protein
MKYLRFITHKEGRGKTNERNMNGIKSKERKIKKKLWKEERGKKKEEEMMSGSRNLEPPYVMITVNPR